MHTGNHVHTNIYNIEQTRTIIESYSIKLFPKGSSDDQYCPP